MKALRFLPLLALVPEAWAVGVAIHSKLGWPLPVVFVSAVLVAGTGFWGIQIFHGMSDFNATLYADEKAQKMTTPAWNAVAAVGVWFATVAALTILLEIIEWLTVVTPLGLVIVGFTASYLYGLSNLLASRTKEREGHRQRRERDRQETRKQRQEERKNEKERAQEIARIRQKIGASGKSKESLKNAGRRSKLDDATLLLEWTRDPYLSSQQMAERLKASGAVDRISRQAIDQRKASMIKRGLIVETDDGRIVEYIVRGGGERVVVEAGGGGEGGE